MTVHKITPIFIVEAITPAALAFWEGTGWTKAVEVPHAGAPGFVLLAAAERALMLQTRASWLADLGGVSASAALYVDVASIADARATAEAAGAEILIAERTTFYGARETWVREPGGTVIGYAEHDAT